MASIAVIPARSGSKRIPNKNFVEVEGESMVNHTIRLAASCDTFDEIIVSVDNKKSADLILMSTDAVKIHFREKSLGSDNAKTIDVIKDVIVGRKVKDSTLVCCLYPTSILLNQERIMQGLSLLEKHQKNFVFSAQESYSNPLRMFSINRIEGIITFLNDMYLQTKTQDLGTFFSDAGQFYWASATTWMSETEILKSSSIPLVLEKWETIDIDSPRDLEIARNLLKMRRR